MASPRKVLTAAQMREVDRRTTELGIPGIVLMENAAHRVVEFLCERYAPLRDQGIVVFCGKGNNGGDGLAIARQLFTRFRPRSLDVLLACPPAELTGDAAANCGMFTACGGILQFAIEPRMFTATLIVDALLGTGLNGPARGISLDWIGAINTQFPSARVVAVDVPSGMPSDTGDAAGDFVRADATVTFTAPRHCHVLAPNCRHLGELRVAGIGSPESLLADVQGDALALIEPPLFANLLGPRNPDGNKGKYGHALVVAGSRGKTGAAAMAGLAVLRAGAGLVTVASPASAIPVIAAHSPELMTEFLDETADGSLAADALGKIRQLAAKCTLLAIGPGLGEAPETASVVRELFATYEKPMVVDADALNILAAAGWPLVPRETPHNRLRVLTPHPGEMSRLTKLTVAEVQKNRVSIARRFATAHQVVLVLKGERTVIAFPNGEVWVNPTGSPSMATGGTGDVLTGMTAGLLAQFPDHPYEAVAAAVWLHGRAGSLGAIEIGEQSFLATDIFRMLPAAMREARDGRSTLDDSYLV